VNLRNFFAELKRRKVIRMTGLYLCFQAVEIAGCW
jgi:hypothetical protein